MNINLIKINLDPNSGGGGSAPSIKLQEKAVKLTENGTREIFPDEDYGGLSMVKVTVDGVSLPKIVLPNGICLSGSTFTTLDTTKHDWSKVTDMSYMFSSCYNLTSLDSIKDWDTSKVTDMNNMFQGCNNLTSLDSIKDWDTSKVTNMNRMFQGCNHLTSVDLRGWNTSNVTDMENMFAYDSYLTSVDLSNWDTSNVTNMSYMFQSCPNLTSVDLRGWDFSKKPSVTGMFKNCSSIIDIWIDGDLSYITAFTVQNGFLPSLINSGHRGTLHYNPQYDISVIRNNVSGGGWDFVPIE